jgi:solute carrier family 25 phosphate transporter 23/24/25/41
MSPSRRQTFHDTLSGAQSPPLLPPMKGDPTPKPLLPPGLENFRTSEGKQAREARLRALWRALPANNTTYTSTTKHTASKHDASPETERAQKMRKIYEHELLSRMGRPKGDPKPVDWSEFLKYANEKEAELWRIFHHELDLVSPLPYMYPPPSTRVS